MRKSVKYSLFGILGLLGIVIVGGIIVASTFDPDDYKPYIIKTVQEKKQRTLTIPGEIKLTFFPKIGADLGKVSLSVNAENLLNVRQTRWDPLLLPQRAPVGSWTVDAWAPSDGRVINGGIWFRFGGE